MHYNGMHASGSLVDQDHIIAFEPDDIDPDDPFEIDERNVPHLAKHAPFTAEDTLDAWGDNPRLFAPKADGPADWLMLAELAGHGVVIIPLAPARSGDPRRCRPIGIYRAGPLEIRRYRNAT